MTYQNYNYNKDSFNNNKKPKPAKNFGAVGAGSDNYQRFLEYLEKSGQSEIIRKTIKNKKIVN